MNNRKTALISLACFIILATGIIVYKSFKIIKNMNDKSYDLSDEHINELRNKLNNLKKKIDENDNIDRIKHSLDISLFDKKTKWNTKIEKHDVVLLNVTDDSFHPDNSYIKNLALKILASKTNGCYADLWNNYSNDTRVERFTYSLYDYGNIFHFNLYKPDELNDLGMNEEEFIHFTKELFEDGLKLGMMVIEWNFLIIPTSFINEIATDGEYVSGENFTKEEYALNLEIAMYEAIDNISNKGLKIILLDD